MHITAMDRIRAILWNAEQSGMTILDTIEAAAFAETIGSFDEAVNQLALGTYRPDILEQMMGK